MRKKLFEAIASITPDAQDEVKDEAEIKRQAALAAKKGGKKGVKGTVSAFDFIKFKVMYQILYEDHEY
jgi:hypothetical protein